MFANEAHLKSTLIGNCIVLIKYFWGRTTDNQTFDACIDLAEMEGFWKSFVSCMLLAQIKVCFCADASRTSPSAAGEFSWRIGQFHAEIGNREMKFVLL